MSSREGFSPRSRTWIKNSCATSVNTIKNPKPLNGSTSIQPVESLAIQLLQLTSSSGSDRRAVSLAHRKDFPEFGGVAAVVLHNLIVVHGHQTHFRGSRNR